MAIQQVQFAMKTLQLGFGLAPTVGKAWEEAAMYGVVFAATRDAANSLCHRSRSRRWWRHLLDSRNSPGLVLGAKSGAVHKASSWIHELDMNRIFERAIQRRLHARRVQRVRSKPTSQKHFMQEVRKVSGGLGTLGIAPPAPAWAVRLEPSLLMKTDPELALYGRYVVPKRLLKEGF